MALTHDDVVDLFEHEYNRARTHMDDIGAPAAKLEIRDIGLAAGRYFRNTITINSQLLAHGKDAVLNTMRHELAHWIAEIRRRHHGKARRGMWSSHGIFWRSYARALGCTGDRCHTLGLKPKRVQRKFEYALPSGKTVKVSTVLHNRIQKGTRYRYPATGERIQPEYCRGVVKNIAK